MESKFGHAGTLDVSSIEAWIQDDNTVNIDFHGEHGRARLTATQAVTLRDWLNRALGSTAETFAEPAPAKVHYSADDYEGLAVALADLLKQVNKFCEESGEGDFYTGCALAALGMSDNEVHVKTLNDLRSQANRGGKHGT